MTTITLSCSDCNSELDYSIDTNARSDISFIVLPCPSCTDDSAEEGRQAGHEEGYKEGLEELFENNRLRDPDE